MRFFLGILCLFGVLLPVAAHDFAWTDATLRIDGQTFEAELICDLDPLSLGNPPGTDDASQAAILRAMNPEEFAERRKHLKEWFQRRMRVRFDNEPAPFEVSLPHEGNVPEGDISVFGTLVILKGTVPEGAERVQFASTRALPALRLTIEGADGPIGEPIPIPSGQRSEHFDLNELNPVSFWSTARRYLGLGFFHIVPLGPDHILFVLGLFLFCREMKPLILQVTAFTVAHTITLALATQGIVSLPSQPVEVLIAASIVYVAVENWIGGELKPHRLIIVFLFGLLHGLGFAGVLGELGLPEDSFVTALLAFNIGVELGQLAVIAVAFLLLGWFRNSPHYQNRVVRPLSLAIGLMALFWVIERLI